MVFDATCTHPGTQMSSHRVNNQPTDLIESLEQRDKCRFSEGITSTPLATRDPPTGKPASTVVQAAGEHFIQRNATHKWATPKYVGRVGQKHLLVLRDTRTFSMFKSSHINGLQRG